MNWTKAVVQIIYYPCKFWTEKVGYDMIKLENNNIAVYVSLKNTAKTQIWHRNAPHLYFVPKKHSVAKNKMCGKTD